MELLAALADHLHLLRRLSGRTGLSKEHKGGLGSIRLGYDVVENTGDATEVCEPKPGIWSWRGRRRTHWRRKRLDGSGR